MGKPEAGKLVLNNCYLETNSKNKNLLFLYEGY